jgi:hypothetical protein
MSVPERNQAARMATRAKIKAGMDSIRAGRTHSAEQVKTAMVTIKKKWYGKRNSTTLLLLL